MITLPNIFKLRTFFFMSIFAVCLLLIPFFQARAECVNPGICIPNALEGIIYSISVGIGGFFLWLGGQLLDFAVQELVLDMGKYMSSGVGLAVDTLWVMVRDTFNIVFIFGIIYIGFKTILSLDNFDTKKTLGLLIVAALMINFSLFITKAIVDVSNATAAQIYNHSIGKEEITKDGTKPITATEAITESGGELNPSGISYQFMNMFRMTTFAATDGAALEDAAKEGSDSFLVGRFAFFGLLMMFVMLIAAFVFAAGAFLLVARFVGLVIFMIFSPAMFAGFIFPHKIFSEYMRTWWEKFLQYAFVAPAYLFMLYLSLFVLASGISFDTGGGFAAAFTGGGGSIGADAFIIFLHFFIIAGFLIAALLVAQKMSIYGAAGSMSMLKNVGNGMRSYATNTGKRFAGGATFGLVARAGRNTIGYGYQKLSESSSLKDHASRRGILGTFARATLKGSTTIADSSFDARRAGGMGKKLGIGEGKRGGYKTRRDEIKKEEEKFAKTLERGDGDPLMEKHAQDIDKIESDLAEQKDILNDPNTEARAKTKAKEKIYLLEKDLKSKKDERKREKYSRIIGSEASRVNLANAKKQQEMEEVELALKRQEYAAMKEQLRQTSRSNSAARKQAKDNLQEAREEIKEVKMALAKQRQRSADAIKKSGYAEVLKNSTFWSSASVGRIMNQDHTAGKEIEQEYLKRVKKTKDDERFDGLKAALKDKTE